MRIGLPIIAAILSVCGAAVTTADNSAEAQTQRKAQRPSPASWAGRYEGPFDGGRGYVSITSQGGGVYRAEIDTSGRGTGCSGSVRGSARPVGNRMTIETPNESQPGICRVTLTRSGARLTVGESNCLDWHGMSCAFIGTVTRR